MPDPASAAALRHGAALTIANGCASCRVRSRAICGALGREALDSLRHLGRRVHVRRGQTLLWESDESAFVGNLLEGALKLSIVTSNGREQIVGVVFPADFVGHPFGKDCRQTVTALTDASICVFRHGAFDEFAQDHPDIQRALLRHMFDELDRARHWMLRLGRMTASERVASLLIELADRLDCSAGKEVRLPLSRQQIGDLLGLAIETVSRVMTRFKEAGLIGLPGGRGLVVHDRAKLLRLACG